MSSGRHRHSHKLKSPTPPLFRAAAVAAPLVTLAVVGVGVSSAGIAGGAASPAPAAASIGGAVPEASPVADEVREQKVTRSADRLEAMKQVQRAATKPVTRRKVTRFATAALDVRTSPKQDASVVDEIEPGDKLVATGVSSDGFAEVRYGDSYRWVTAEYLSADKPATPETMGLSDAPCPDGSVENGLTSGAVRVYRAVCHNFPQITSYGGYAARGEHASGKAIDIMTSDVTIGTEIADFLRAHASELDLYDVIWRQHIWTPVRASEGFRSMSDRGSETANHYDHVHVSVN